MSGVNRLAKAETQKAGGDMAKLEEEIKKQGDGDKKKK